MNKVDTAYLNLLQDVLDNGAWKNTRSGRVKSVFGRQMRFNLKEGLPLLTTKKVFTKGIIHELLWFLQHPCNSHGSMNIEYLVRNGVHIWDDDAYRWFKQRIVNEYKGRIRNLVVCLNDDENEPSAIHEYWIENELRKNDENWLENITKEEFLDLVIQKVEIQGPWMSTYRFGDVGPIYGKQWRLFGHNGIDQIQNVINTLKNNPNDRRMLCVAYNPDYVEDMALPPCHVMFQFYTRELTTDEKVDWLKQHVNTSMEMPKYALSCMWTQRSADCMLGIPFNIMSYSVLTHMIAKLVNMVPDELIASLGDCHIYEAHFDAVKEQLTRKGSETLPKLIILGEQKTIDDFKFKHFTINDYYPDPPIKAPLLVGL